VGDVDGDGRTDLVLAAPDVSELRVVRSSPFGIDVTTDGLPEGATTRAWDRDLDGFGADETFEACDLYVPTDDDAVPLAIPAIGPTDCDDGDDSVFPGATEATGDDVDADCDGFADPNQPPVLTVVLPPVATDGVAIAQITVDDPDVGTAGETPVSLTRTWSVDGTLLAETGEQLDGTFFDRGQTVLLRVVADDGRDAVTQLASFVVPNSAPEATATILSGTSADDLVVQVDAADADADATSVSCTWQRDDAGSWVAIGAGETLPACDGNPACEAGDTLRATCDVSDDEAVTTALTDTFVVACGNGVDDTVDGLDQDCDGFDGD
jgi:hypothetical protein